MQFERVAAFLFGLVLCSSSAALASGGLVLRLGAPPSGALALHVSDVGTFTTQGAVPPDFIGTGYASSGVLKELLLRLPGGAREVKVTGTLRIRHFRHSRFTRVQVQQVDTTERYDATGYPESSMLDPAEVAPMFAKVPVVTGASWSVAVPVTRFLFGSGVGKYAYVVRSITEDARHHTIVALSDSVRGVLRPDGELAGYRAAMSGKGTVTWDATARLCISTDQAIRYSARNGRGAVLELVTLKNGLSEVSAGSAP